MIDNSLSSTLREVVRIVERQGEQLATSASNAAISIEVKTSIGDLVTELDANIDSALRSDLSAMIGGTTIISEESGVSGSATGAPSWIIDPIDGTTNFVHGIDYFAISVALRSEQGVLLGVVHNPRSRHTFYASRGGGSFYHRLGDAQRLDATTRLRVSSRGVLSESLLSFGLPYDRSQSSKIFAAAESVYSSCRDLRRQGSAALDLVSIAQGVTDGHFELELRYWDIAAAGLILQEAGGKISDWSGKEASFADPDQKVNIVASNGKVHSALVRRLVDEPYR